MQPALCDRREDRPISNPPRCDWPASFFQDGRLNRPTCTRLATPTTCEACSPSGIVSRAPKFSDAADASRCLLGASALAWRRSRAILPAISLIPRNAAALFLRIFSANLWLLPVDLVRFGVRRVPRRVSIRRPPGLCLGNRQFTRRDMFWRLFASGQRMTWPRSW